MPQAWFATSPDDDSTNCTYLVCPTCACPNIHMVGHDFTSQEDDSALMPDHELTIEFMGACGHFWMIFLGDFGNEVMLDVQAEDPPRHPRNTRRISTDRHWK